MDIDKMGIEMTHLKAFRKKYEPLLEWLQEQKNQHDAATEHHAGGPLKSQTSGPFAVGGDGGQRPGANAHGIGPDTDGGPNPDYKPDPNDPNVR